MLIALSLSSFVLMLLTGCRSEQTTPDTSGPVDTGAPASYPLHINEFVASSAQEMAGGTPDWIELYNHGDVDIALEGWALSSGQDIATLRDLSIPAGGFLVLYADGAPELGPDHLPYALPVAGGSLRLQAPDSALVDALEYPKQATDISATRAPAGGPGWVLSAQPSPGQETLEGAPVDSGEPQPLDCTFAHTLPSAWLLEGDLVSFEFGCQGGVAELLPIRTPEGAEVELGAGTFLWQTGAADAGTYTIVFSLRGQADTQSVPQAESVALQVADDLNNPDNVAPDPFLYTQEWGLPVFHIEFDGAMSQSYTSGTVVYEGQERELEIKIRGATSASYAKTSYTLSFPVQELQIEGWPKSRNKLVLVSNFDDNSYVRQKLVYDQWQAMAEYWGEQRLTPRSYFAVVYLNGEYHGLYMALDKVDDEFVRHMGFESGNLYKAVNHDANFALTDSSGNTKSWLGAGYEQREGEEGDYAELEALVAFTGGASAQELLNGAEDWLSLTEFMDWFLLVHYSLSEDSAGKNSYLHAEPGQQRLRFTPWDFNHSWGQNWYTKRISSDAMNDFQSRNRVFWAIQTDPAQEAVLWQRFEQMREDGPYNPDWLVAQLDGYYAQIEPSAARDWARWEHEYRSAWWASSRDDWIDYQGEKAYVYAWLDERAQLFEDLH